MVSLLWPAPLSCSAEVAVERLEELQASGRRHIAISKLCAGNRQNSEKNKMLNSVKVGIANDNRIFYFTIYLPNLVYWGGFVTGVTFTTHL